MRIPRLALALLALCAPACRADSVSFARVWPQWHDGSWFTSYHEYKTGEELVGKWTVLRSTPGERTGMYFLTRVENAGARLEGAVFTVRVIRPDSTETKVFTFPAGIPAGSQLFELGLTGGDWVAARTMPVAWEVELRSPDGRLLAQRSSFLWEKPDASAAPGAR